MNLHKKTILIIVLSTLISACAEVSYKRGASVRDVENAHKACRGVPEAEFSACLQKQGWETPNVDDSDLFAEVSITDNRGAPPTQTEQSVFVEVEKPSTPQPTHQEISIVTDASEASTSIQPQPSKTNNVTETTTPQIQPPVAETKSATIPAPAPAKQPVDPLKTYKINSWWKFGGTPEHLKRDQAQCENNLGEAHQANMATQTYTRGLIECLHKNGWKALKAIK